MIETIIADYLQHNRRIVIPELGAFLKKEGGETVFVPFLNKDDGVLTGLVRQKYGTSAAEAAEIIAQYTDKVRSGIAQRGACAVAPLGALKQDASGILFLDTADHTVRPVQEAVVEEPEPVFAPEPEFEPEPEPEPVFAPEPEPVRTVAESLDAPKTLNDLIREKQERADAPATLHERMAEAQQPIQKTAPASPPTPLDKGAGVLIKEPVAPGVLRKKPETSIKHPTPHVDKGTGVLIKGAVPPRVDERRGDRVLIGAIIVALIAVIAMIYAYFAVDPPTFNLQ